MTETDATALLKAEKHLRFHDLRAGPEFDAVTLWVDGAALSDTAEHAGSGNAGIDRILGPMRRVEAGPGCLRYTVTFLDCAVYIWRNETYTRPEPDEDYSTMLRHYERSAFLDFTKTATCAADVVDDPLQHFAVVTLDAVLDVLCPQPPQVTARMLGPDDPGPLPGRATELR